MRSLLILTTIVSIGVSDVQVAFAAKPKILRDIPYADSDDLALSLDVCQPRNPNGAAVLYMVSGGWYSRRFDPNVLFPTTRQEKNVFGKLIDEGFTLFLVRHRSAPTYKVPDAVSDVRTATRFVRSQSEKFRIDPSRFGAMGASAGGHLSLMLGTADGKADADQTDTDLTRAVSDRVQAVVAYFPPTDLRPILFAKDKFPALDFDPALAKDVSPLAHVTADDAPTLLVHGTADRLVPLLSSQAIHLAFSSQKVPVKLITLNGAGHGFQGDFAVEANNAAVTWFKQRLVDADGQ